MLAAFQEIGMVLLANAISCIDQERVDSLYHELADLMEHDDDTWRVYSSNRNPQKFEDTDYDPNWFPFSVVEMKFLCLS